MDFVTCGVHTIPVQYWHNTTYRDTFDEFLHVWYLLFNKVIHEEHVVLLGTKSIS